MVNGREGGEGDATGGDVAAVERLLQLSVPDKSATWIFDTRRGPLCQSTQPDAGWFTSAENYG